MTVLTMLLGAIAGTALWALMIVLSKSDEDEAEAERVATEIAEEGGYEQTASTWTLPKATRSPVRNWQWVLAVGFFGAGWQISGFVGLGLAAAESIVLLPMFWRATAGYNYVIDRDEALMAWLGNVRDLIEGGSNIQRAITYSTGMGRPPLELPIRALSGELAAGATLNVGLYNFAERVASPSADALVATLTTSAEQGASKVIELLNSIIDEMRLEVSANRDVILKRQEVLNLSKWTSILFTIMIGGAAVLLPDIMEGYKGVIGQTLLVVFMLAWGGSVLWLYRVNRPPPETRIALVSPEEQAAALRLITEGAL